MKNVRMSTTDQSTYANEKKKMINKTTVISFIENNMRKKTEKRKAKTASHENK